MEQIKDSNSLLTVILIGNEDSERQRLFEAQTYPSKKIVVCDKKDINKELANIKGGYLHICEPGIIPESEEIYAKAIGIMDKAEASIGCFGWKENVESTDEVQNGYCGTGNGYAFLSNVIKGGKNPNTSYGTGLFNKIFRIDDIEGKEYTPHIKEDLYELATTEFLIQLGDGSHKAVFEPTSLFVGKPVGYEMNYGSINGEKLFSEISKMIEKSERISDRLLEPVARMCMKYEMSILAQLKRRKWEGMCSSFEEHIKVYYNVLVPKDMLIDDLSLASYEECCLSGKLEAQTQRAESFKALSEKLTKDRDWLQKRNEGLIKDKEWLQKKNEKLTKDRAQQEELLNKKLVRLALKIHRFFEKIKNKSKKEK